MRTWPARRNSSSLIELRHHRAVLSGVAALAVSTTIPIVLRLGGHLRSGEDRSGEDGDASPLLAPRRQLGGVPNAPRPVEQPAQDAGQHDAVQGEQAEYGRGFDQHSAHERGRPIAWVVVAVIVAGTCVSGISLIMATPWLFWTGAGVVVVGVILGRATHAMRDERAPLLGTTALRSADIPSRDLQ